MTDYPELYRQLAREILKHEGKIEGSARAFVVNLAEQLRASGHTLTPEIEAQLTDYLQAMQTAIREGITQAATLAAGLPQSATVAKLSQQAFDERWPDGLRLSDRLWHWSESARNGLTQVLRDAVKTGESTGKTIYTLQRAIERAAGDQRFKVVERYADDWVKELHEAATQMIHDPSTKALWQATVADVEERILGLKTTGTRTAAERVLDQIKQAVAKGNEELVDRAVKWWLYDKQLYGLKRIARTEMATAMHRAVIASTREDDSIIGYQWRLSASHPVADICFRKGTKIATFFGVKPIEEVRIGDKVLTHKGRFKRVIRTYQHTNHHGFLVRLKFQVGKNRTRELLLTPNHPVLTDQGWQRASDVKTGCHGFFLFSMPFLQCAQWLSDVACKVLSNFGENALEGRKQNIFWAKYGEQWAALFRIFRNFRPNSPETIDKQPFESEIYKGSCRLGSLDSLGPSSTLKVLNEILRRVETIQAVLRHSLGYFCPAGQACTAPSSILFACCNGFGRMVYHMSCNKMLVAHDLLDSIQESRKTAFQFLRMACFRKHFRSYRISGLCGFVCVFQNTLGYKKCGEGFFFFREFLNPLNQFLSRRLGKFSLSLFTGAILIDKTAILSINETVFNMEVEDDHSYIANGLIVHNCDYYASVEMGLGKGVFTKDAVPRHKAHPHCMCLLIPRVTPIKQRGSKHYADWLKNLSAEQQAVVLPKWAQVALKSGTPIERLIRPDGLGLIPKIRLEAFIGAKNGGKYHGWYLQQSALTDAELQKGIKSFNKQIEKHRQWIDNPYLKIPHFDEFHQDRQKHLVERKWPQDIQRHKEQIAILEGILEERSHGRSN